MVYGIQRPRLICLHHSLSQEMLSNAMVMDMKNCMSWPGKCGEVKDICSALGLEDVTNQYLNRDKVKEYFDMKCTKEEMEPLEKRSLIRNEDCQFFKCSMYQKFLEQSRLEFIWQTQMLDTRTTMKRKYPKDQYSCSHCLEGKEQGFQRHLLTFSVAAAVIERDLRVGLNPEEILEYRAAFLRLAISKRITLEDKLKTTKQEGPHRGL